MIRGTHVGVLAALLGMTEGASLAGLADGLYVLELRPDAEDRSSLFEGERIVMIQTVDGRLAMSFVYHGGASPPAEVRLSGAELRVEGDGDPDGGVPPFRLEGKVTAPGHAEGRYVAVGEGGAEREGAFHLLPFGEYEAREVVQVDAKETPLPVACTIEGVYLVDVEAPVDLSVAASGEAWVRSDAGTGVLRMPGCKVTPMSVDASRSVMPVAAGGVALCPRMTPDGWQPRGDFLLVHPGEADRLVEPPPGWKDEQATRRLSSDGRWVLFRQDLPGYLFRWIARSVEGKPEVLLELPAYGIGDGLPSGRANAYRIRGLDMARREVVLAGGPSDEILIVGLDGSVRWGPASLRGIAPHDDLAIVRADGGGWAGWGIYRDDAVVVWDLGSKGGSYRAPKGHRLEHVCMDPSGRYIAMVSVWGMMKPSRALSVIRTTDQTEVLRRSLNAVGPSDAPAFLGPRHLAYGDVEDTRTARKVSVTVVELP